MKTKYKAWEYRDNKEKTNELEKIADELFAFMKSEIKRERSERVKRSD